MPRMGSVFERNWGVNGASEMEDLRKTGVSLMNICGSSLEDGKPDMGPLPGLPLAIEWGDTVVVERRTGVQWGVTWLTLVKSLLCMMSKKAPRGRPFVLSSSMLTGRVASSGVPR